MKKSALIAFSTLLMCLSAGASNYHVKTNGSDSNNGLTFNTAFKTIQTATNKVVAGDTVFVYDGFYKGFDHFYKNSGTAGKEIVYMAAGANVVINQSCGRGFDGLNIEGSDYIQVIGFKVSRIADANGSGEDGIRAVLANHITIKYCEVDSCYRGIFTGYTDDFLAEYNVCKRSYGEHGIYVSNNSDRVVIRYNVCFGNSRAAGIQLNPDLSSGAPGLSYQVSIYNNICYNNRIGLNLQGLYDSDVYNNLIYNNGLAGGGNGITLFHGDAATGCNNVRVFNNTVFVPATSQWAILAIEGDSLFVYNNILLSASPKGCLDIESSCTHYFGDYNLLNDKMTVDQGGSYIGFAAWQSLGHDRNSIVIQQNADVFKDLSNMDFHLSLQSTARNAGTALVSGLVHDDLEGRKRPQGNGFDIGCYETPEATVLSDPPIQTAVLLEVGSWIRLQPDSEWMIAEIYDLNGRWIAEGTQFEKRLFHTGLYVYRIRDIRNQKWIATGKVMIHR